MINKIAFSTMILALAMLSACNSDKLGDSGGNNTGPNSNPTVRDRFLGKFWVLASMQASPGIKNPATGEYLTDIFSSMDACDKDDITEFKNNNTIMLDHGLVRCDANEPDFDTDDTWKISEDNTFLITTSPEDGTDSMKILDLKAASATLSLTKIENGASQVITITIKTNP